MTRQPEAPAGTVEGILEAVRRSAQQLAEGPTRPSAVRVRAGDVAVDLEWAIGATPGVPAAAVTRPEAPAEPARDVGEPGHQLCAPTVGVFYRAPEPGAPPFVAEGDMVEPGQQVAVVEAMKMMIPVEADRRGKVLAVLKPDGGEVEYGEALFTIAPVD